jgi:hypothetical protein
LLQRARDPRLAAPYDYTDNWYAGPAEAGWGVNFTQTNNFIFATLFIYGPEQPRGQPTWYTAQLTWDGATQFVGGLYRTEGTYFNSPWNPANSTTTRSGSRRSRLARRTTTRALSRTR